GGDATCLLGQRRCRRRILPMLWTPKPGKMPSSQYMGEGATPWCCIMLSVRSSCAHSFVWFVSYHGFLSPFGDMTLWNILASYLVIPYISSYPCVTNLRL